MLISATKTSCSRGVLDVLIVMPTHRVGFRQSVYSGLINVAVVVVGGFEPDDHVRLRRAVADAGN